MPAPGEGEGESLPGRTEKSNKRRTSKDKQRQATRTSKDEGLPSAPTGTKGGTVQNVKGRPSACRSHFRNRGVDPAAGCR